jgi:hypothetical protein
MTVTGGVIGGRWKGSVSPSGAAQWVGANKYGSINYTGTLSGRSGSGVFSNNNCKGTYTAKRM